MKPANTLTAAQEILLAASDLYANKPEFTEWDLSVETWKRNPNRFGCRGYEQEHPDHKRVMTEIMGTTKKDNPIRRGWMKKTRPNCYTLTPLGQAEASALQVQSGVQKAGHRSPQAVYDAVFPYLDHRAFKEFTRNQDEPRTWLKAASFLGITKNDALHLEDRLRALNGAIAAASEWFDTTGEVAMRRGATGSGSTITRADVDRLATFQMCLRARFKVQFDALRKAMPRR